MVRRRQRFQLVRSEGTGRGSLAAHRAHHRYQADEQAGVLRRAGVAAGKARPSERGYDDTVRCEHGHLHLRRHGVQRSGTPPVPLQAGWFRSRLDRRGHGQQRHLHQPRSRYVRVPGPRQQPRWYLGRARHDLPAHRAAALVAHVVVLYVVRNGGDRRFMALRPVPPQAEAPVGAHGEGAHTRTEPRKGPQ